MSSSVQSASWAGPPRESCTDGAEPARLQVEEGIAGALQKVRLVLDEQDGLARRLEAGDAFGDALAVVGAEPATGSSSRSRLASIAAQQARVRSFCCP